MIVKEKGWDNKHLQDFKRFILDDLFVKLERSKGSYDKNCDMVDNFFYLLVASDTCFSTLLPDLKYSNRFYIFTQTDLPSGSRLFTLTLRFRECPEPAILEVIY